jgi:hypothetical protein
MYMIKNIYFLGSAKHIETNLSLFKQSTYIEVALCTEIKLCL